MDRIGLDRLRSQRQPRCELRARQVELGDLAGELLDLTVAKYSSEAASTLDTAVEHDPLALVIPGVYPLVAGQYVGQHAVESGTAQLLDAPMNTVVVLDEQEVRPIRADFGIDLVALTGGIAGISGATPVKTQPIDTVG